MSSAPPTPRVSIALSVYNGENYLAEAIESILAQTFEAFELIISDNASTDGTAAICRKYARQDARIRYFRQPRNLGAAPNYNWGFAQAQGEFFKWAAHDDYIAPTFLERCVAVLDADAEAVLAYPMTVRVSDDGEEVFKEYGLQHMRLDAPVVHHRFFDLLYHPHRDPIFGLIRSSALRHTSLIQNFADSDGNLLAELSLQGRFVEVPEKLFYWRQHPDRSIRKYPDARKRAAWFDTSMAGKLHFPAWRALREYAVSLSKAPLRSSERLWCYLYLMRWAVQYRWRVLAGELRHNTADYLRRIRLGRYGQRAPGSAADFSMRG